MWELDHEENWVLKNQGFWTVVLKKTLESPLDCKEIQLVHPKENQSLIFIGRTDAEASILWPPDAKSWLVRKDPVAGKDWRQEEKGTTEDEMVGWCHKLNGHEFEHAPVDGEGQGSLVCCSPKELDMTEWKTTICIYICIYYIYVSMYTHTQGYVYTHTQGLNPGLLHCRQILYQLSHKGSIHTYIHTHTHTHTNTHSHTYTCMSVCIYTQMTSDTGCFEDFIFHLPPLWTLILYLHSISNSLLQCDV